MACGHARVQRFDVGSCVDLICLDCDHTWAEYPGELVFAHGSVTGNALLLLAPRDERGTPDPLFTDEAEPRNAH